MSQKHVLIVGVGDIGGHLAESLVEDGYKVWGLRRSNKPFAEGAELILGDVGEVEDFPTLPEKIDYMIYSVASPEFTEEGYQRFYVAGLINVLNHMLDQGIQPKHCFFVSSTSVYQHHDGSVVDETTETHPTGFSGKKMLAAEKALLEHPFPGTVIRFSGIYGPGRNQLINQAKKGGHCDPEPPVWTNRIHRDDCIGILKFLIDNVEAGKSIESIYLASDEQPAPLYDVLEWLKDRIGEVEPDVDVPEVTRRANKQCNSQKIRSLGYKFKYSSYQDGYEVILTEMGY